MPKTRARTGFTPKLIAVAVASCFVTSAAFANPTGPAVVNGQASFHQQGNLLQITNSPNAIINWQSFSIGASEITRFLQQSASSAVLNRVIAQNPSSILGALQSNGRVFLLNPNGIVFGAGSQVDVAGLVASTLNLSNADFLAGRLRFTEVPGAGSVINQGNIRSAPGGQVYLVGSSVTNSGSITSPKGEVILAAGNSVELVNPGTPNLRVEISAPDNEVRNLGAIVADAGRVGIYAGLINHSGTIRADSAVSDGGRIVLKATKSATLENSSILSVQGNGGGEIVVLAGDSVQVAGRLDASAPNGGDGGFIETSAHNVYVESGTVVTTAAPQGKTGTWLIDPTDFTVAAGSGAQTASGIGADTLSANLGDTGVVISTSPAGAEPGDIFVNAAVAWSSGNDLTLTAHRDVNVNSAITSTGGGTVALNAGWNGTSPAATPVVTPGTGTIRVNAPITVTDDTSSGRDATIKLTAGGAITVNNNLTATGGNISEGVGSAFVTLNAGTGITVNSSTISATGGDGSSGGSASVSLNAGTSPIQINASTIRAQGGVGDGGFSGGGGASVMLTGNGITVGSGSTISAVGGAFTGTSGFGGFGDVNLDGGAGGITVNSSTVQATGGDGGEGGGDAIVQLTAPGSIVLGSTVSATGGSGFFPGFASVIITSSGGNITNGATIIADGAEGSITMSVPMGFIASTGGFLKATDNSFGDARITLMAKNRIGTLANPIRVFHDQPDVFVTNTTSGDVVLSQVSGNVTIEDSDFTNNIVNNAPGGLIAGIAESGNIVVTSSISKPNNSLMLKSNAGDVIITAASPAVTVTAQNVTLTGNNVNVGSASASGPTSVEATGTMTVNAGGNVNVTGGGVTGASARIVGNDVNVTSGGSVNLTAGVDSTAFAQIEALSASSITLTFPNLASGGFFVNGQEGVTFDSAFNTGFIVAGDPVTGLPFPGFNVTYGRVGAPPTFIDQVVASINQQVETLTGGLPGGEGETGVGTPEEKEKKKELPVCK